jgi:ribonuclease T2
MLEPWMDAVRDGVHNAAASLQAVAPHTTDAAMPSLRTLSKLAIGGAQVLLGGQPVRGTFTQQFNAPGGQILQTQFWDTNPPTGPDDSWTLHGLW